MSQQNCQRYSHCLCKQHQTLLLHQLHWEEMHKHNQNAQLEGNIRSQVYDLYNFVPNLSISTHLNARKVLGNTEPGAYYSCPHNLTFHNLTNQKIIHQSTSQVLGLSLKFIPTPTYTSSRDIFDQAWSCFERNAHHQIYFAGTESNFQPTQLYLKSTYRSSLPPLEMTITLALLRLHSTHYSNATKAKTTLHNSNNKSSKLL